MDVGNSDTSLDWDEEKVHLMLTVGEKNRLLINGPLDASVVQDEGWLQSHAVRACSRIYSKLGSMVEGF